MEKLLEKAAPPATPEKRTSFRASRPRPGRRRVLSSLATWRSRGLPQQSCGGERNVWGDRSIGRRLQLKKEEAEALAQACVAAEAQAIAEARAARAKLTKMKSNLSAKRNLSFRRPSNDLVI